MIERIPVAGLLPMRTSSTRCLNKMLRPFGDTTLARLAVEKLASCKELDRLYVAAYEDELLELAAEVPGVVPIRRSHASAFGEDASTIYDFLPQVTEPILAIVNACCPFAKPQTLDRAVLHFRQSSFQSLLPVVRTQEWYFDETGHPLNIKDPSIISSKLLEPVFRATHPFTLCRRERFVRDWTVWTMQPDDPHLFEIPDDESLDIDTEFQFEMAEALYVLRQGRRQAP